jgi:predicted short-subunit dehydrogenase-like oxidoreductase (DUF2520 family)
MRQVPHYLIIGNGRVARHFQFYFTKLKISYSSWHRQEPHSTLQQFIKDSSHILLLISDGAIEEFIAKELKDNSQILIHFSGSLITSSAYGTHPLMTFSDTLYPEDQYKTIPFIIDQDAPAFHELFPALPNAHFRLAKELKGKYHALCVLSGNFSCMLWQKLISSFENEFKFNPEIAQPYLLQQTQNILNNHKTALTGPLVRNDFSTIKNNIAALDSDPFQDVYKSFIECYQKLTKEF